MCQETLKTIENLEQETTSIESRMQDEVGLESDYLTLSAEVTGCKTQLVSLHTDCDKQLANTERQRNDKKKRLAELKRFQNILLELEQWLEEAQTSIKEELKLTSVEVVEKQIKASQVGFLSILL